MKKSLRNDLEKASPLALHRSMPIYTYRIIKEDGTKGDVFELEQSMNDAPLLVHPETGEKVVKIMQAPNLGIKHTEGKTKRLLDDKNVEKAGFTKYVKDKVTGDYHKVAGKTRQLPDQLNTGRLKDSGML